MMEATLPIVSFSCAAVAGEFLVTMNRGAKERFQARARTDLLIFNGCSRGYHR